jgi:hypothetical protein
MYQNFDFFKEISNSELELKMNITSSRQDFILKMIKLKPINLNGTMNLSVKEE